MSSTAKSLVIKAQDCITLAKQNIDHEDQHELVGYNLAQAVEFFLKALCSIMQLEIPPDLDQHDLDALMEFLEDNNFSKISSHADLVELTPYNNPRSHVRGDARLNLNSFFTQIEDLKALVAKELR